MICTCIPSSKLKGFIMVPFSQQQVPPAVKSHLDSQFSFFVDMSKRMFDGVQRISELNMQIAQNVMEEAINGSHQLMESNNPHEYLAAAVGQLQPMPDRMRSYQQKLNNIAANVQVDLSKTAEQHLPQTTRTASAVAEEVIRRTAEENDKVTERQKAVFDKAMQTRNDSATQQNGHFNPQQAPQGQQGKQQPGKPN